jgi:hypothetical protein
LNGLRRGQSSQRIQVNGLYWSVHPGYPRDEPSSARDPNGLASFGPFDELAQVRLRLGDCDIVHDKPHDHPFGHL